MKKRLKRHIGHTGFGHGLIGAVLKILCIILLSIVQLILFSLTVYYIFYSKIDPLYADVDKKLVLYEQSGEDALRDTGRYRICDENGNYLAGVKDIELEHEKIEVYLINVGKKLDFYTDPESLKTIEGFDKDVTINIWIRSNTDSGKIIYFEECLVFKKADMIVCGIFLVVVIISIIFFIIFGIISVIKSALIRKRIMELLFSDDTIYGKNWLWFCHTGEKILKRRKYKDKQFFVVNILLVRYRNYCVCHSVTDGEKLLQKVHNKICFSLNKPEIAVRSTSSNFALLLVATDEEALRERLEKLLNELENIVEDHKFNYQIGVKKHDHALDIETEFNYACSARMTLDDDEDSGICFFDEKLLEEAKWNDMVVERQQYALDNEEFKVYYQPKYDPRTDELKGAEALIRWQSDVYGFVSPGRIIPIFEDNGFITEIDHYMIRHVARDQKRFKELGYKPIVISVNVSRAHFMESDLAEQIRDIVDEEGADHSFIEIELTESAFFDDKKAMITTINKLKEYGFAVSMDDFGSGYSSLNSLKDMPLDVLKLDAEFFRGDTSDERREIVVSEAIKLAKNLNMKTVAEGVEIKEQVDFLAKQGCDLIQGYYYAKPMPVEEFEVKLST